MLTWQRQIYSGAPKIQMPNIIYTYTVCPEGRYIYIIGANIYIRTTVNVEITQKLALWIFDCAKLNMSIYNLHYETYPGKIVDFYSLSAKKCVLLMYNNEMKLLTQYLLVMNKETNDTVEILCRNWKIDASEALRVGYGGLPFGYIVVSGYTTPELGNVLDVRMLPADPESMTIPAVNMDIPRYSRGNFSLWMLQRSTNWGTVVLGQLQDDAILTDKRITLCYKRRYCNKISMLKQISFLPNFTFFDLQSQLTPTPALNCKLDQQGEELIEQLTEQFEKTTETIEEELVTIIAHWKLISISVFSSVILIIEFIMSQMAQHNFCYHSLQIGNQQRYENESHLIIHSLLQAYYHIKFPTEMLKLLDVYDLAGTEFELVKCNRTAGIKITLFSIFLQQNIKHSNDKKILRQSIHIKYYPNLKTPTPENQKCYNFKIT
uniref:Uncharacterized protein n=1 Tax=Wuchereria bancrofti TaxID=6293 RepID=A0AAF5PXS1_WUCBA